MVKGGVVEGNKYMKKPVKVNIKSEKNRYFFHAGTNNMDFRLVIITGVCRSGKTLLGKLLGSMRNVEYDDEPWLPMMLPLMQDQGLISPAVAKDLLRAFTEEVFNDIILLRRANFRPRDKSTIWNLKDAVEIFERLIILHTRDDARNYAKEKDPILLYVLPEIIPALSFLIETFPHCKIIHIIRNGLDVAFSVAEKQWFSDNSLNQPRNNYLIKSYYNKTSSVSCYLPWWVKDGEEEKFLELSDFARGLYYWRRIFEIGEKQREEFELNHPDIYKEVKFEDIIRNTMKVVNDLANFLDAATTPQTALISNTIDTEILENKTRYPINELPIDEIKNAKKLLHKLGYSLEDFKEIG